MTNTTPIRFLSFDELKGFGIRFAHRFGGSSVTANFPSACRSVRRAWDGSRAK